MCLERAGGCACLAVGWRSRGKGARWPCQLILAAMCHSGEFDACCVRMGVNNTLAGPSVSHALTTMRASRGKSRYLKGKSIHSELWALDPFYGHKNIPSQAHVAFSVAVQWGDLTGRERMSPLPYSWQVTNNSARSNPTCPSSGLVAAFTTALALL